MFFSSTTRLDSTSPTSPKSLVRTLFKAFSEKEAMFFWAAVPYCKIWVESVMSIFWANSSTIFRSASDSMDSSMAGCGILHRLRHGVLPG